MTFLNPLALLATVPVLAAIIALYLLKMRRRELTISSNFLWPSVEDDIRANAPFQKLKPSWLLALQLLCASLIGIAFARPQILESSLVGPATVFVIDPSMSMGATDVPGSRLEEAKRLVRAALSEKKPGSRISILAAEATPRVASPLGEDLAKHRAALDSIQQTDSQGSVAETMQFAASLVGKEAGSSIVLVSDGNYPTSPDFAPGKATVSYLAVGTRGDNLGIESLSSRNVESQELAFVSVRNYGTSRKAFELELSVDGQLIASKSLVAEPGALATLTQAVPPRARILQAAITPADTLEADNRATALLKSGGAMRVLLVSAGNIFLERALGQDSRVQLDRAATPPKNLTGYDLVVLDNTPLDDAESAKNVLSFGSGSKPPIATTGVSKGLASYVSAQDDSIASGIDWASFGFGKVAETSPVKGAKELVRGSSGSILLESFTGQSRWIHLALNLNESEMPLNVAFPIFIGNVLDSIAEQPANGAMVVQPGRPIAVRMANEATLRGPNGLNLPIKPNRGAGVIREIKRAGEYSLTQGNQTTQILATTLGVNDSEIMPQKSVQLGKSTASAASRAPRFADQWRPVLLICLLVLILEWGVYLRRS